MGRSWIRYGASEYLCSRGRFIGEAPSALESVDKKMLGTY